MENSTDENLVRLVQDGNNEMFGVLIERYEPKMKRYARRFISDQDNAEDLIQEIFIKAYTHIASFDLSKRFSPWLYRIAHNCFVNELKRKGQEHLLSFDADILIPNLFSRDNPEKEVIDNELKNNLEASINKISIKYREILILYYFEEMSYKEISDILHIPVSVVGVRLNRGKKALQKIIKI